MPMVADSLASGNLVEALPAMRMDSPLADWLTVGSRNAARPEVSAFREGLKVHTALARQTADDVPDPDRIVNID